MEGGLGEDLKGGGDSGENNLTSRKIAPSLRRAPGEVGHLWLSPFFVY